MDLYDAIDRAIQECRMFEFNTLDLGGNYEFQKFISVKFYFYSIDLAIESFRSFSEIGRHCQASNGIDKTVVIYGKNNEYEFGEFSRMRDTFSEKYPGKRYEAQVI
jgi:hypothetical protein